MTEQTTEPATSDPKATAPTTGTLDATLAEVARWQDEASAMRDRREQAIIAWHEGGIEQRKRDEERAAHYETWAEEHHRRATEEHALRVDEAHDVKEKRARADKREEERLQLMHREVNALERIALALEKHLPEP